MEEKSIVIVPKITKVEWDMRRLKKSEKEIIEFYRKEGLNVDRIFESHKKQHEGLEKLKNMLPEALIVARDDMNNVIAEKASLVISYGGDNHFQYITHFLKDTPILGINSDPTRSEGALTSVAINEIDGAEKIINNKFSIERWPRLQVSVNNKEIDTLCIADIFIGEQQRYMMSRMIITHKGKSIEQKGSGLIIATGAGSSGWYHSASRYLMQNKSEFKKTAAEARFIFTEPYDGKLMSAQDLHGIIKDNETLDVTSLCDSQAVISIDSLKIIPLPEGSKINIKFGSPLKVVKLN